MRFLIPALVICAGAADVNPRQPQPCGSRPPSATTTAGARATEIIDAIELAAAKMLGGHPAG